MKRVCLVILSVLLVLAVSACGKGKQDQAPSAEPSTSAVAQRGGADEAMSESTTPSASEPSATLAPSSNKEVVTAETAPKVYWAMDIAYHLKDCPELKGKEYTEVTWEMVKEIGLRQCPVCNPPQYESYVENND